MLRGRLVAIVVVGLVGLLALPAAASAKPFGSRALKQGSRGPDVRVLQDYLTRVGFRTAVDGHFGSRTRRSVRRFERAGKLRIDGRVSKRDARTLRRAVRSTEAPAETVEPRAEAEMLAANSGGASYVQVENAILNPDGTATAPEGAPQAVKDIIAAGNEIAKKPYRYGGGHGKWKDSGYDCSGSVSYALYGAGLLKRPLDSTGFESYGKSGRGTWVTIYANSGHVYMVVAGLRFDTSGAKTRDGSRWTDEQRSSKGFVVRSPAGL